LKARRNRAPLQWQLLCPISKDRPMKRFRSLDNLLPVVFVAFALLCGATLWQDLSQPIHTATTTTA
jgi:hypothetical protein